MPRIFSIKLYLISLSWIH